MSELLHCWSCGAALVGLILPMSRREECPACDVDQHVCRLCRHYDPAISDSCREDRAEAVVDKERANFCDYFEPVSGAYNPAATGGDAQSRAELAALFGDEPAVSSAERNGSGDTALDDLNRLFSNGDNE